MESLELQNFKAKKPSSGSNSEDSDLEPPFEIHGIGPQNDQEPLLDLNDMAKHEAVEIEDFQSESSENDVPESIQYENRPLIDQTRAQYMVEPNVRPPPPPRRRKYRRAAADMTITSWENAGDLDIFLRRLYEYYAGKGLYCIVLESITNLLTVLFVVGLTVFLTECVDFSKIHQSHRLTEILVPQCYANLGWVAFLAVLFCSIWWSYQFIRLCFEIPRLLEIKSFYEDVFEISEAELQSCLWSDVVNKIIQTYVEVYGQSPHRRIDAHIIANRIMRKENYLIAMFNKDILDLRVPFLGQRHWMTRLMQDYIAYGIFSYVFDQNGKFRKRFLKHSNKPVLVDGLKQRFQTMAVLTLLFSPFLFIFLIIRSFFKLSEEYRQNPALLAARSFTPLAMWNFREFNELPHLFNRRLTSSHAAATKYIQQFPNPYVTILARFVSFVSGSFATVLLLITLFEEELQQGFEITPNRSAFFYIGLFGSLMAVTQGLTQENIVHEPQRWMNELVLDTHYYPEEWRNNAHLTKTRDAFSILFEYKIVILVQELLSVLFSPLILYYSLPQSAGNIIDFFRNFTIHVDSLGHVCNFAVFDLERQGNRQYGARADGGPTQDTKLVSNNGKLEHSFMNFKANNPDWNPGVQGSQYISRVMKRTPLRYNYASYSRMAPLAQSEAPMFQGESVLNQSAIDHQTVGREFVQMLDAFYDANRRI